MLESSEGTAMPSIIALPPTTVRQIGSGQVLVDPSSVVKEFIDNALDARAKSIFVDITANSIDSIQVKDDGHGIPAEDRPLMCRRYCTSKIRDLQDLKDLGGKWLGFRGEALSSTADMSGSLFVTTRVEGELVGVKIRFGRNGELISVQHESHPVGTTVKVTGFFENTPVRKQTAIKNASKCLAKIRRLVQAYALARPSVRFRLRILKAKNNQNDFVYAPKTNASIEDAVLKVISKDCASQCDWTALESDGFEIHAFLPKLTAISSKIANFGAFVSIDARPVSNSRGTVKQLVANFKDRLRKSGPSFVGVKDPFFCMNLICPPDSYDPNIEPAKDDVMFEDGNLVIGVFERLLISYYPEAVVEMEVNDPPAFTQPHRLPEIEDLPAQIQTIVSIHEDKTCQRIDKHSPKSQSIQPQWRSSMYDFDEEDLEFIQESQAPVIEQEEGRKAADISNPWTIARMNTAIKPKVPNGDGQLLSPAKSLSGTSLVLNVSTPVTSPIRASEMGPLTPQSASRTNASRRMFDQELAQSIRHLPQRTTRESGMKDSTDGEILSREMGTALLSSPEPMFKPQTSQENRQAFGNTSSGTNNVDFTPQGLRPAVPSAPRRSQRKAQPFTKKSLTPPTQDPNETWFGQPMRGSISSQTPRRQQRSKTQDIPMFASDISSSSQRSSLNVAERTMKSKLYSNDNTDIRDFFRRGRGLQDQDIRMPSSSLTSIDSPLVRPQSHSMHVSDQISNSPNYAPGDQSRNTVGQLHAYDERAAPPRPSTVGTTTPILFDARLPSPSHLEPSSLPNKSNNMEKAPHSHRENRRSNTTQEMEAHFRAIEEREASPSFQSAGLARTFQPRIVPSHGKTRKTRRIRPRTTEGLERTKSSKLPLECIPRGCNIQDLILSLQTGVIAITQNLRKLNMTPNTLEWGYPVGEDADDVFAEPVSDKKIMAWVIELDNVLHEQYDRLGGVDTRCALHEGIQQGLDTRKEVEQVIEASEYVTDSPSYTAPPSDERVADDDYPNVVGLQDLNEQVKRTDDELSDFSISEFVDLDAEISVPAAFKSGGEVLSKVDEFEDDLEDDMLLDL